MSTLRRSQPLPEVELENLRRVCEELGLPESALDRLEICAFGMRLFELGDSWNSAPKRKIKLGKVARLATQLNRELQGLVTEDRSQIHIGFRDSQIRLNLVPPDPFREGYKNCDPGAEYPGDCEGRSELMCENVLMLGDVLLTLDVVATQAIGKVAGSLKGGRRPDLKNRAYNLSMVAELAHTHGIPIERGKDFTKLCAAVFRAAGISENLDPDKTIEKYVKDFLPFDLEMWAALAADESSSGDTIVEKTL